MEDGLVRYVAMGLVGRGYVLILVVMEDGLVRTTNIRLAFGPQVLILVVMEDGLVPCNGASINVVPSSLNPCCNGRWSRTRPYKTILIISKLKNFAKQILTFLNRKLTIP